MRIQIIPYRAVFTMDMTRFSIVPESLRLRKVKVAIVFLHERFRFEVWLSGSNRNVQEEYWKQLKEDDLEKYHLATNPRTVDYMIDHILVGEPDFGDLEVLTMQIERGTLGFIEDVREILSRHTN